MAERYTHAIVCRVPASLGKRGDINPDKAILQHEKFVAALRTTAIDVVELPPDETLPFCAFVEHTAVIVNGMALITRPVDKSRVKEVEIMKSVLRKELNLSIIEIGNQDAYLDGGDVLFTGKEFFVGVGTFTNEAGARAVAAAFPEYACSAVKISEGVRLKSLITMAGPDVLCVGAGKIPQSVLSIIKREASHHYSVFTVPEDKAANVLYVNGILIHRSPVEVPESSFKFSTNFEECHPVNISEMSKIGYGPSSCCLLMRKSRHPKIY